MAMFQNKTWVSHQNVSILDYTGANDDGGGGDNWSCKMCKAPVKSSPPTNQNPAFYEADALPSTQPTVSKHWRIQCTCSHVWSAGVCATLIVFCITEPITRGTEITKVCNTSLASDRSTCKVCRILLSTSIQNCTFYYTMNYSIYLSNTVIMVGGIRSIGAGRTILVSAVSFSALQHTHRTHFTAMTGTKLTASYIAQPSLKQ